MIGTVLFIDTASNVLSIHWLFTLVLRPLLLNRYVYTDHACILICTHYSVCHSTPVSCCQQRVGYRDSGWISHALMVVEYYYCIVYDIASIMLSCMHFLETIVF
jgi:hypothetical protein